MNIHEYQAKGLLAKFGVGVLSGQVAYTADEAVEAAKKLGGQVWVVKAQIHAGGRGKGGGVKVAKSLDEVRENARRMIGMNLVTHQTGPKGKLVKRIYVESGCDIRRELYLGMLVDRATSRITIMASTEGGVEIEKVAAEHPEKIIKVAVDPATGIQPFHARKIGFGLGLEGNQVSSCTKFITDGIRNAIPSNVTIKGDTRSYSPEVQALLQRRMREVCQGICSAHGASVEFEYTHEFAPTVNWPQSVPAAVAAASAVVGADRVEADVTPMMISEDFGAFLRVVPGAFVFIGNGANDGPGGIPLHNARYDFNDQVLPIGARYFAEVARIRLAQ